MAQFQKLLKLSRGSTRGTHAGWRRNRRKCAPMLRDTTNRKHISKAHWNREEANKHFEMRNTVKHQQQPSTDGELCGDLLRTEGSSSLKSTRASSTGETRGKPIKRRASKLQKNGAYIRQSPPTVYLHQPESRENEADRPGSLSLSLLFSRRFEKTHTQPHPSLPFFA
jgi:hypothetical protein